MSPSFRRSSHPLLGLPAATAPDSLLTGETTRVGGADLEPASAPGSDVELEYRGGPLEPLTAGDLPGMISGLPWAPDCVVAIDSLPDGPFVADFVAAFGLSFPPYSDASASFRGGFEAWRVATGMPQGAEELDTDEESKIQAALELLASPLSLVILKQVHDLMKDGEIGLDETIYRALHHIIEADLLFPDVTHLSEEPPQGDPLELEYWTQPPALDPSLPLIGLLNEQNPAWQCLYGEGEGLVGEKILGTGELERPDGFVFPLYWPAASTLRLVIEDGSAGMTIYAYAPIMLSEKERTPLETVRDILRGSAALSQVNTVLVGPSVLLLKIPILKLVFWTLLGSVARSFRSLADSLDDASDSLYINDSAAYLVEGLRNLTTWLLRPMAVFRAVAEVLLTIARFVVRVVVEILRSSVLFGENRDGQTIPEIVFEALDNAMAAIDEFEESFGELDDQTFFGLDQAGAAWLQLGLMTPADVDLDVADELLTGVELPGTEDLLLKLRPVISLDADWFDWYFDDYATGYDPHEETGRWPGSSGIAYVPEWLAYAGPTMQFVRTLDLASRLFELLLQRESLLLTAAPLADTDGLVGGVARGILADHGAECVSELMGGLPASRLLRFLWRQSMADMFVAAAVAEKGADADCLWSMFCWNDTVAKRAVVDATLGEWNEELVLENMGALVLIVRVGAALDSGGDGIRQTSSSIIASFSDDLCDWWSNLGCLDKPEVSEGGSLDTGRREPGGLTSAEVDDTALVLSALGLNTQQDVLRRFLSDQTQRCSIDETWFDSLQYEEDDGFIDEEDVEVLVEVVPGAVASGGSSRDLRGLSTRLLGSHLESAEVEILWWDGVEGIAKVGTWSDGRGAA